MEAYQRLEVEWAEFNGVDPKGMVCCSSGTAALHLALEALGGRGTNVVLPDYTMVACARAVTLAGRFPSFIDCRADNLLMSRDLTYGWIDEPRNNSHGHLHATMVVHVYGRRADVDNIGQASFDVSSWVVEDSAEAHGVRPSPQTDAACWSFYRNKVVAGEEGGAVWFRDREAATLARSLRSLGFTDAHDYTHVPRGHNYRMSNLHALTVLTDLKAYPTNLARRRELEAAYDAACPLEWRMPLRDVPWVYDLRIPGLTVDRQRSAVTGLRGAGVAARYGFKPMTTLPEYERYRPEGGNPNAETAAREVIYLPCGPNDVPKGRARDVFDLIEKLTS